MSKLYTKLRIYENGGLIVIADSSGNVISAEPKGTIRLKPFATSGFSFEHTITGDLIAYVDTYDDVLDSLGVAYGANFSDTLTALGLFFSTTNDMALEILDEGVSLTQNAASIDFVGSGVIATKVGNNVTVTVDGDGYLTATIDVSSAQILAMGTAPIELLPAPGIGNYYEYFGNIEYTFNTTAYNSVDNWGVIGLSSYAGSYFRSSLDLFANDRIYQFDSKNPVYVDATNTDVIYTSGFEKNESIVLTTYNGLNPTLGDGTMKVKIKYKVVIFG